MSKTFTAIKKLAAVYEDLLGDSGDPVVSTLRPYMMRWEGRRTDKEGMHRPYKDIAGVETIGYGLTDPKLVDRYRKNGMTELRAQVHLNNRLNKDKTYLSSTYPNFNKLNPYQQAALTSFHYNIGSGAFAKSTLRRRLDEGKFDQIPAEMSRWKYSNKRVVPGLVNRRNAEIALWNHPWQPEPKFTPPARTPMSEPTIPGYTNGQD